MTIGTFLTEHPQQAITEWADTIKPHDLDVRQDAAVTAWRALNRHGLPDVGQDGTLAGAFDENEMYAVAAWKFARGDANDALHGRSKHGSRRARTVYLDSGVLFREEELVDGFVPKSTPEGEAFWDQAAAREFRAVDLDGNQQLAELCARGEDFRRAVGMMTLVQRMKLIGEPLPSAARTVLKKLRKSTGLALDVGML